MVVSFLPISWSPSIHDGGPLSSDSLDLVQQVWSTYRLIFFAPIQVIPDDGSRNPYVVSRGGFLCKPADPTERGNLRNEPGLKPVWASRCSNKALCPILLNGPMGSICAPLTEATVVEDFRRRLGERSFFNVAPSNGLVDRALEAEGMTHGRPT